MSRYLELLAAYYRLREKHPGRTDFRAGELHGDAMQYLTGEEGTPMWVPGTKTSTKPPKT